MFISLLLYDLFDFDVLPSGIACMFYLFLYTYYAAWGRNKLPKKCRKASFSWFQTLLQKFLLYTTENI